MWDRVFLGTSGDTYWAARLSDAATSYSPNEIITDVNNNVYVCGSNGYNPFVVKLTSLGAITWQRVLSGASSSDGGIGVVVDSNSNVYVGGAMQAQLFLMKYDSGGTLQWQRSIGYGAYTEYGRGVAIDSSDNLYLIGRDAGTPAAEIIKFDNSGVVQWQRNISSLDLGRPIVAGDNNLYVSYSVQQFSTARAGVAKYSNTGTLAFQNISTDGGNAYAGGIASDSDNNIYVAGPNGNGIFLYKMNSSGTILWSRFLTSGVATIAGSDCHVDGTGVFVTGYTTADDGTTLYIARYDLSGNLQWQRSIQNSILRGVSNNIYSKNGTMFIVSRLTISGVNSVVIFKLPNDGSLTGTIALSGYNFVYGASTLTNSNSGGTWTDWGGSGGTTTHTAANSSYTSSNATLTSNTVAIT